MIAGFVEPTVGRDPARGPRPPGREAGQARARHRVPELRAVPAHDGGRERRLRPRDAGRGRGRARRGASRETLALVGSAAFADRFPRRMSGGQQQRVALARALVIRPRILLLDEPLSNLDAKLREEMQIELRQIQRTVGTTTILVTHDQAEAMALSRPHRGDEPGPRRADRRRRTRPTSGRRRRSSRASSARPTLRAARRHDGGRPDEDRPVRPDRSRPRRPTAPAPSSASSRATTGSTRSRRRPAW